MNRLCPVSATRQLSSQDAAECIASGCGVEGRHLPSREVSRILSVLSELNAGGSECDYHNRNLIDDVCERSGLGLVDHQDVDPREEFGREFACRSGIQHYQPGGSTCCLDDRTYRKF